MAKHYIRADGSYAGTGVDGAVPVGAIGEVPASPLNGAQVWSNGDWRWPIETVRARRLRELAERYQAALEAGMAYGGKVLQIREQDQGNLTTMGNEARWAKASGSPWPADFAWRMADDSFLSLDTADKCIALALAAKVEVIRLRKVKWAHADAIRALQSAATVEAYDIETGW